MNRLIHYLRLLGADLRHDRVAVICEALALASVLLPLMVLLGLRAGVIGTLIERMDRDPAMRLILPEVTGANRFDEAWFARWSARPDVAFLIPNTRAIAGQVDLVGDAGTVLRVSLNPTAPGDPLGAGVAAQGSDRLALTAEAARRLSLKPGDTVELAVERTRRGRVEPARLTMTVAAVLDPAKAGGAGAYVGLPLLLDIQAYRDGHTVPSLSAEGDGPPPPIVAHPLFRLYARSIRDVAPLAEALREDGVQPSTRETEITATLRLDANLVATLGIIAAAAGLGAGVALLAGQLAALGRKRRDLAVLKLVGYGAGWLAALPMGAVLAVCLGGLAIALPLFAVMAAILNDFFAASLGPGETACRLSLAEIAMLAGATILVASPAGLAVGARAARLEPAEEIRDV